MMIILKYKIIKKGFMKLYLGCMPCVMKQITSTIKRLIKDENKQYDFIERAINSLNGYIKKEKLCSYISWRVS